MSQSPTRSFAAQCLRARLALIAAAATLVACGGGDDGSNTGNGGGGSGGGGGGTLTLSATVPASHSTTLDLTRATTSGNMARAADSFSASPYCEVFWENVPGANGGVYAVQVYFRQSDHVVLHTSVLGGTTSSFWSVYRNEGGTAAVPGIAINAATRTLTYTNAALAGSGTELATVNGSADFPANATVPACGA